ncbi:dCTP deaminase domain-containing protein [Vannielia litorea]|uniref:dCTP deaminase domain-containing protein n=1 Tax=Vannielia litorea TaxID=1217970 RepID=UPI001C97D3E6|nr:hypothetical protein [Vannielia litorea]MBY6049418.1 hypothetical protein [Vannielia litorea]MBY6076832.1 hypothetical protein [Vannielia litorea]
MATQGEVEVEQPSGFLLKKDIRDLKIISEGSAEHCFKPASYDLRIGDLYVSTDGKQQFAREPLQGCNVVVPPLGSLIVSTREFLRMPGNVVGDFDLRIKLAVKGLFVQMGTQVEPHYKGRLFAIIHNVTASPVELKWGGDDAERIFTIQFAFTNGVAEEPEELKEFRTLRNFLENTEFAENQIGGLLKLVEENRDELKTAMTKIESSKTELERSLDGLIENRFAVLQSKLDAKTEVDRALTALQKDERAFKKQLLLGGLGIAAFSVLIPFLIGFAINFARPLAFTDFDQDLGGQLSTLEAEIETIKDSSNGNNRLDAVATRIDEISTRLLELQRQIENSPEVVQDEVQNPSANSEVEQ